MQSMIQSREEKPGTYNVRPPPGSSNRAVVPRFQVCYIINTATHTHTRTQTHRPGAKNLPTECVLTGAQPHTGARTEAERERDRLNPGSSRTDAAFKRGGKSPFPKHRGRKDVERAEQRCSVTPTETPAMLPVPW